LAGSASEIICISLRQDRIRRRRAALNIERHNGPATACEVAQAAWRYFAAIRCGLTATANTRVPLQRDYQHFARTVPKIKRPCPKIGTTLNAHAAFSFRGTRPDCSTFPIRGGGCKERVTSNFDFPKFTLFTGSNSVSSAALRCDHCRAKLRVQHCYWRMRFCSANCVAAYQKRLSKGTQAKIVKLDGDQIPLRLVS